MGHKTLILFEFMILVTFLCEALAVFNTQEHAPSNENLPEISPPDLYLLHQSVDSSKTRHSRSSPSNQIRFGRSQSFVRFGRSNGMTDDYPNRLNSQFNDKFVHLAPNYNDNMYPNDENIRVETRGLEDNGFIRFGRSQSKMANKNDEALRSINWRNFLRLGRNTNANIRFAGKRDGSSTLTHHNLPVPLDVLMEKYAQRGGSHRMSAESPDNFTDDGQMLDDMDANIDQTGYSGANGMDNN